MNNSIKNIREALNVSQVKMSEMIGIGRTRYMKYEKSERGIPVEIAYKLIDIAKQKK